MRNQEVPCFHIWENLFSKHENLKEPEIPHTVRIPKTWDPKLADRESIADTATPSGVAEDEILPYASPKYLN
jgi:hypothetical protein